MNDSSILWLRVAAGLYSLGLLDAVLTVLRRKQGIFSVALGAFGLGALFQLVSIVEQWIAQGQFPVSRHFSDHVVLRVRHYGLVSGDLRALQGGILSIFIFPLVFLMTLVAALRSPFSAWSNPAIRSTWLVVHVVLSLLGYAALLFTAAAAVVYLVQERQLKRKNRNPIYHMLPPLGTLDELISRSLGAGFTFITAGIVIASVGAHRIRHALDRRQQHRDPFVTWARLSGAGLCTRERRDGAGAGPRSSPSSHSLLRGHLARSGASGKASDAMKLLLTGLSHKTAPLDLREKFAIPEAALPTHSAGPSEAGRGRSGCPLHMQPGGVRALVGGRCGARHDLRPLPDELARKFVQFQGAYLPARITRGHSTFFPRSGESGFDGGGRAADSGPA